MFAQSFFKPEPMNFKKTNNLWGWAVFIIASLSYILTAEARGSYWDCGEFVSSCYKIQIPHPPGAPLFVLMGRFFIILFGNNPLTAAKAVNVMSALASGFTILFLFWTITYFARRIVHADKKDIIASIDAWKIFGAGVIGALAFAYTDSFWYSAVEGEVYACSSFFSAIVFWAILKWCNEAEKPGADRWLVLIFFLIGLSIGVHLLCLLDIPAVVMAYYFKKRDHFNYAAIRKWFLILVSVLGGLAFIYAMIQANSNAEPDHNLPMDSTLAGLMIFGTLIAIGLLFVFEKYKKDQKALYGGTYIFFIIGCALTGIMQKVVIQYSIQFAGDFDRIFKNDFGLPFFTGFTFFFLLLAFLIWRGLKLAEKKKWPLLRLCLWCVTFVLIGYSSYLTTMIRSNANPSIDMYNVDNPISLAGYLGRDQYGDFPLLYGQKFTALPLDYKNTSALYEKTDTRYENIGNNQVPLYSSDDEMILPRVWDSQNDQYHADYYASFLGIKKYRDNNGQDQYDRTPDQGDNIRFFLQYQVYWMYFRYFMWNFCGKQNDLQGVFIGNPRDGNWISGIPFLDNLLYGDQSLMPDTLQTNKSHNTMFGLPLILGILGLVYQYKKRSGDWLVNMLLFFFTGFAIILYLNQAGNQPRERDYAYTGSFYAFGVWIGLGVLAVIDFLSKKMNQKLAAIVATVVCFLAVPVLMAQQEWDDHDRSQKLLPGDMAKDYLESCAPNAILFTFGDNDTYPLWYAQEVEGVRPDIRIINYSLLGTDWYGNEFRYKVNEGDSINLIWTPQQILGQRRDYAVFEPNASIPDNRYYDLYDMMKNYIGSDDPNKMDNTRGNQPLHIYPVRKVSVPVDKAFVLKNGTCHPGDSIVDYLRFEIPKFSLMKNDLLMLNIIAANHWQRPIYFSGNFGDLGFGQYLRRDGLAYRLVPVQNDPINDDYMFNVVMKKFAFGGAERPGTYFDEENRRHLLEIRSAMAELASDLADKGRKADAIKVLEKADAMILDENMPYGLASRGNQQDRTSLLFLDACYKAGDQKLILRVSQKVRADLLQQLRFYNSLSGSQADNMNDDKKSVTELLQSMEQMKYIYSSAYQQMLKKNHGKIPANPGAAIQPDVQ